MATMNISLPDQMKSFAEDQAKDGRFSNVSDYVRDLIRRDQARQDALAEVQTLIDDGMASGSAKAFDMATFVARQKSRAKD